MPGLAEVFLLLLVLLWVVLGALIVMPTLLLGISPMPTLGRVRRVLLDQVPSTTAGNIFELGSGWGGLARALARRCPGAQVTAYEASPVPFAWAWLVQTLAPLPNLTVRFRDFFKLPRFEAQLVVCYLWTGAMERLKPRLQAELPDGAVVLSHTFGFRAWQADEEVRCDDLYRTPVYRFVVRR